MSEKKFFKNINLGLDFRDMGNQIFRGTIEVKTFDLKDVLKEKGYNFESKRTSEVRNGQPVTVFTQKKEIYVVNDLNDLRKQVFTEVNEIVSLFQKTLVMENQAGKQEEPQNKKP